MSLPLWQVRANCEYSAQVRAATEEEAVKHAKTFSPDDWDQSAWSPIEAEREEEPSDEVA